MHLIAFLVLVLIGIGASCGWVSQQGKLRTAKSAAERGDARAQFDLGGMYYEGQGVPRDYSEAAKWYRKAAEQGLPEAQTALGSMYDVAWVMGNGKWPVPQDDAEAVRWYRKAAEQGFADAQKALGEMYRLAQGVPKIDFIEAVKWYRKAAEQGSRFSQIILGDMYSRRYAGTWDFEHQGVPLDLFEAAKWYREAAEGGTVPTVASVDDSGVRLEEAQRDRLEAQRRLGDVLREQSEMYTQGVSEQRDYARAAACLLEAAKWYREAADHGDIEAKAQLGFMFNSLGILYESGRGVSQDYAEAAVWYRRAADRGQPAAQCNLGLMYANGRGVPQDYLQSYVWLSLGAARLTAGDHARAARERDRVARKLSATQIERGQRMAGEWKAE